MNPNAIAQLKTARAAVTEPEAQAALDADIASADAPVAIAALDTHIATLPKEAQTLWAKLNATVEELIN